MNRKHSYRQIVKRRFNSHILFYLKDPEDAKGIFEFSPNLTGKDKQAMKRAFEIAEHLRQEKAKGKLVNCSTYTPYCREIEKALNTPINQPVQTQLF